MSVHRASAGSQAPLRFDGRVAVVTGAGGGLGKAYAVLLASRGAKVVVNDVGGSVAGAGSDTRAADRVVSEIRAAGGEAVADYNSVENGAKLIETAMNAFGRVDILICNAGILRDVTFGKMDAAAWDAVYRVHLLGSFACARAAWNIMRENQYGRIVFVTSSSGLYGNIGQANYAAAKMGIVGLANTLAREGSRRNIIVNTVAPIAASRMTEGVMPPDLLAALAPEYVAPVVAYLCHESCNVSGGLFEVGGGWAAKLRFQRSAGVALAPKRPGDDINVDEVRAAWSNVHDFSAGATFPDSTQATFAAVMDNLRKLSPADAAKAEEDTITTSVDAELRRGGASAAVAGGIGVGGLLEALPGGTTGRSEHIDVAAALKHAFKRKSSLQALSR